MAVLFSGNSHFVLLFFLTATPEKVVKAGEMLRMNKVIKSIYVCPKCATKVKTENKVVCCQPLNLIFIKNLSTIQQLSQYEPYNLISLSFFFNTEYLHNPRSRTMR